MFATTYFDYYEAWPRDRPLPCKDLVRTCQRGYEIWKEGAVDLLEALQDGEAQAYHVSNYRSVPVII